MKNLYIILNLLTVLALISCKNEVKTESALEDNLIEISKAQFNSENMQLGHVEVAEIKERMAFTGTIVPMLNGIVKITAPVPGKIRSVKIENGEYVKVNQTLFTIGGSELIDLQHDFASSSAKIKQLKAKFNKAKILAEEKIITDNEYLLAESGYRAELANYSALKTKLRIIGLNHASIENGKYVSEYCIKAPISGQITRINIVGGQQINAETEIAEIIDSSKTELRLALFEKDYSKIKIGQLVNFWDIGKSTLGSSAKVNRIVGKLNSSSNTIDCFASILTKTNAFAINEMVNGEVILSSDSAFALPHTALLEVGTNLYVLIKKSEDENRYLFEKKKIRTGKSSAGYTEVLEAINEQLLIKGAYNISLE